MGCDPGTEIHHTRPPWWPGSRAEWWAALLQQFNTSEEAIRSIVAECAERKMRLFSAFHEYSRDDLIQIGVLAVHHGLHRFNPKTSSLTTFVNLLAFRRIRDEYRARSRRAKPESVVALDDPDGQGGGRAAVSKWNEQEQTPEEQTLSIPILDERSGAELVDWLLKVYLACKSVNGADVKQRTGRKWFSPAQCQAAGMLMMRLGRLVPKERGSKEMVWVCLPVRQAAGLFARNRELCRAIRFLHAPSRDFFDQAKKFLTKKFANFSGLQKQWFDKRKPAEADSDLTASELDAWVARSEEIELNWPRVLGRWGGLGWEQPELRRMALREREDVVVGAS